MREGSGRHARHRGEGGRPVGDVHEDMALLAVAAGGHNAAG